MSKNTFTLSFLLKHSSRASSRLSATTVLLTANATAGLIFSSHCELAITMHMGNTATHLYIPLLVTDSAGALLQALDVSAD
jgi:hypothetical protein